MRRSAVTEAGRSGGVGEYRKPAAYSVTEQSFPTVAGGFSSASSSPLHHFDLRDTPPAKLPFHHHQLCGGRTSSLSSPSSAAGSLRPVGRVRFLDGRLQQDGIGLGSGCAAVAAIGSGGGDPMCAAHRLPEIGEPASSFEDAVAACVAGSSATAPSSILRARGLRGGTQTTQPHQFQTTLDDLPPPSVNLCNAVVSSDGLLSKYNRE